VEGNAMEGELQAMAVASMDMQYCQVVEVELSLMVEGVYCGV
jgi:hypothetical protein